MRNKALTILEFEDRNQKFPDLKLGFNVFKFYFRSHKQTQHNVNLSAKRWKVHLPLVTFIILTYLLLQFEVTPAHQCRITIHQIL